MIRDRNHGGSESDSDTDEGLTALCGEPIYPGDMIFYYHEAFGARPIGERYATVVEIDPEYKPKMLSLDNMDVLAHDYSIRRIKKNNNGILQEIPDAPFRQIREYVLKKGSLPGKANRKSLLAQQLERAQKRFSDQYVAYAEKEGYPIDLVRNIYNSKLKSSGDAVSEYETDSESSRASKGTKESEGSSIEEHEYMKLYSEKAECRKSLESMAAAGQKKQADDVNRDRSWGGGEHLPKDTMCTLTLTKDKAKLGIKDLPVQIVKLIYYKQSESIRYQLCCKEGVLKGTFGRNELNPQPHLNPELMGINYQKMKEKDTITPSEAHEKYLDIGGKNKSCRCQTDCSKSKSCKCRKYGKLCNKYCHKRAENLLCKLCVVSD